MSAVFIKFGCGGVDLSTLHRSMWEVLKAVNRAWTGEDIFITSTWEGTHLPWSRHYRKCAIDLRYPQTIKQTKIQNLKTFLGKDFDVVEEENHLHIEFDPKEVK
jgi:hypothetical protein